MTPDFISTLKTVHHMACMYYLELKSDNTPIESLQHLQNSLNEFEQYIRRSEAGMTLGEIE